jgi:drug/metabolite transporter (DMT)-like permease
LYGYVFFGNVPDGTLFIGVAIVISSGLYILYRETRLGRQVAAQPVAGGA